MSKRLLVAAGREGYSVFSGDESPNGLSWDESPSRLYNPEWSAPYKDAYEHH